MLESLQGEFEFRQEDTSTGARGLRVPQIGALHAVLGYWSTNAAEPATVVMPTGTGKTETMLSLLAYARPQRLLVIVPSDALRTQVAEKFETLGVLQAFGVVGQRALRPVVGRVHHGFSSATNATAFARSCNVVVATPAALAATPDAVRIALLEQCSHLFIDEAHHVPAITWREIRDQFSAKKIVQFTATPFREDGRHLSGRLIFNFPLREAQRQGYFSKISYVSILELSDPDYAIAKRAVEALRSDLAEGLDHILMARTARVGRAEEVKALYDALAQDLHPAILYSKLPKRTQVEARAKLRSRESRIVVCVDMLGEGFDLPALKVAAIHDAHKSLGVTLQFVGRFARVSQPTIGDATVVVGRPRREFDTRLRDLYREDSDWNLIIRDLSQGAISEQEQVGAFEEAFASLPEEVPIRALLPKMSAVVYRTHCDDWDPDAIVELFGEDEVFTVPIPVNERDRVAWFVTRSAEPVKWGDSAPVENVTYELYVLYWNQDTGLLYINSSKPKAFHEELAEAVCGEDVERIVGEVAYRAMAHIERLVPTNVGLLDVRNRSRRFSMHVGADVIEGFPVAEAQTKTKTNIFAYGYEDGRRVSVGASLKGRVWSYRVAPTLKHWMDWCNHVGSKLIDDAVNLDELMKHFIRPEVVTARPALVPLALEWPWQLLRSTTEEVRIEAGGESWPVIDVDLSLRDFSRSGPILFLVSCEGVSAEYAVTFDATGMHFHATGQELVVTTQRHPRALSALMEEFGLHLHLEGDSLIVPPGLLLRPNRTLPPFDTNQMMALDWSGIDLRAESMGPSRRQNTVQWRVLQHVLEVQEWEVVIDDDGAGEIADIVAMRREGGDLKVLLVHCKFALNGLVRAQVEDLYQVCGQASKSATWRRDVSLMLQQLVRRERGRQSGHGRSGLIRGNAAVLYALEDQMAGLRPSFKICVAQPAVSKARVSPPQLELLASVDTYVREVAQSGFEVLCSA